MAVSFLMVQHTFCDLAGLVSDGEELAAEAARPLCYDEVIVFIIASMLRSYVSFNIKKTVHTKISDMFNAIGTIQPLCKYCAKPVRKQISTNGCNRILIKQDE